MNKIKRIAAVAVAACLVMSLAACGGINRNDATVYVQGRLDAQYKGEYSKDYIDLVEDMTQADAEQMYNDNAEIEAEYLLYILNTEYSTEGYDEAVLTAMNELYAEPVAKAQELIKEIYSHAKYTVGKADKLQSGDFAVEVTVSPIEIVSLIPDEVYEDTWSEYLSAYGITSQEQMDAMADEDYMKMDAEYAMAMLEYLEGLMDSLTYGEDQIIMIQLKLGEDNYYSLVDSGVQKLDEVMIDYTGAYMK